MKFSPTVITGILFCFLLGHAPSVSAQGSPVRAVNCTIKPLQEVSLSAPTTGVVRNVLVVPGQQVEIGDLIIELDSRMAEAERNIIFAQMESTAGLESAEIRAAALESREARLRRGFNLNAVSAAELELAQLELADARSFIEIETERLDLLQSQLAMAEVTLDLLQVRSPVAGVIGEDLIDVGESVSQVPVGTIYVNQPLRVEAFVASDQLLEFLERDSYEVLINREKINVELEFDYRAAFADLASNTVSVYFVLNAPNVLPGSQCEIPPE